jgi:hypothetical protein
VSPHSYGSEQTFEVFYRPEEVITMVALNKYYELKKNTIIVCVSLYSAQEFKFCEVLKINFLI